MPLHRFYSQPQYLVRWAKLIAPNITAVIAQTHSNTKTQSGAAILCL